MKTACALLLEIVAEWLAALREAGVRQEEAA